MMSRTIPRVFCARLSVLKYQIRTHNISTITVSRPYTYDPSGSILVNRHKEIKLLLERFKTPLCQWHDAWMIADEKKKNENPDICNIEPNNDKKIIKQVQKHIGQYESEKYVQPLNSTLVLLGVPDVGKTSIVKQALTIAMREHLLHPPPMTLDLRSPEGQSHQLTGVLSKVKQGLGGFLMDVSPLLQGSATLMGIPFPHRSEKDSHSLKGKSIEEILQSQAETLPAALRFYKTLVKKASEEYEKDIYHPVIYIHAAHILQTLDSREMDQLLQWIGQVTQQERLMDVILSTSNGLFFTQLSDLLGHKVSPLWIDDLDAVSSHTLYMELKKSLLSQAEVLGHHLKEKNIPHFEEMYKFLGGRAYHYSQVLSVSNFENLLHGGDGEHWLNPLSPRAMRQAYLLLYPAMMSRGLVRRYGEPNWTKEEGKCIIKAMAKTVDGNIPMEFFIKDESVSIPALKKLSRMNVLGYKPEMGQPLGCGTIIPSSPLQLVYIKRLAETF